MGKAKTQHIEHGATGRKRGFWSVVFVVSLIVLILSVGALIVMGFSYFQGQQKYNDVANIAITEEQPTGDEQRDGAPSMPVIDWEALRSINPDIVAWVRVPNTPIDYPVVQGPDNEYYLHHDFEGASPWLADFGCIFLDSANARELTDDCNFIYGHHLNDGSMFAAIASIGDQARFYDCSTVFLLTPTETLVLKGFAYVHCSSNEEIVKTKFADPEEKASYISEMLSRSLYTGAAIDPAAYEGRIFALSTCDDTYDTSGRYIMFCREGA